MEDWEEEEDLEAVAIKLRAQIKQLETDSLTAQADATASEQAHRRGAP